MAQRLDFIDISHYQNDAGPIDFAKVKSAGVLGVIANATDGTKVDSGYAANRAGALAQNLAFASYHYLYHGNVSSQMAAFIKTVAPLAGERVVIDYEDDPCTIDDLTQAVAWLQANRPDLEITVYGASKLTDDAHGHADQLAGTSLWAARFSSQEPNIATDVWPTWSAWQYSETGKVGGITGNVDLNQFNGSRDNCLKWFGPASAQPAPAPAPAPQLVAITDPAGTITVTVNGGVVWPYPTDATPD